MPDPFLRFKSIGIAVLLVAAAGSGRAQETRRAEPLFPLQNGQSSGVPTAPAVPAGPMAPTQSRTTLVDPNKRLAVGDQVSVEIVEDREPPISKAITATGELEISPLGRVRVVGKTTAEVAADLKHRLEEDYYYKATVRISIDRVNAAATMGKVQVQGEVRAPGVLEIFAGDNLTLNEAILRCGNFKEFADPTKVKVTRRKGNQNVNYEINVKDIQRKGAVEKDIVLEDGDRVFVPKAFFRLTD